MVSADSTPTKILLAAHSDSAPDTHISFEKHIGELADQKGHDAVKVEDRHERREENNGWESLERQEKPERCLTGFRDGSGRQGQPAEDEAGAGGGGIQDANDGGIDRQKELGSCGTRKMNAANRH